MYVVCDLLLAETSKCPYILFSDVNLSWIVIPSSPGSTKVEALDNLVLDLRSRYTLPAVSYPSILVADYPSIDLVSEAVNPDTAGRIMTSSVLGYILEFYR